MVTATQREQEIMWDMLVYRVNTFSLRQNHTPLVLHRIWSLCQVECVHPVYSSTSSYLLFHFVFGSPWQRTAFLNIKLNSILGNCESMCDVIHDILHTEPFLELWWEYFILLKKCSNKNSFKMSTSPFYQLSGLSAYRYFCIIGQSLTLMDA